MTQQSDSENRLLLTWKEQVALSAKQFANKTINTINGNIDFNLQSIINKVKSKAKTFGYQKYLDHFRLWPQPLLTQSNFFNN